MTNKTNKTEIILSVLLTLFLIGAVIQAGVIIFPRKPGVIVIGLWGLMVVFYSSVTVHIWRTILIPFFRSAILRRPKP